MSSNPEKLEGEATIEFKLGVGPRGTYVPMMVITRGGGQVETALTAHGFKYKEDAEKVVDKSREILTIVSEEDEGSEV